MKAITKYSRRRFGGLIALLKSYENSADAETLHAIRLEMKKLRTLFHLANASVKNFRRHKNFQPLRLIFKKAGKIRQADIQNEIEGKRIPEADERNKLRESFRKEARRNIKILKALAKTINEQFEKIHREDLQVYLKKRKTELRALMFPRLNQRGLHESRKIIKEILYLSNIGKKHHDGLDPFFDKVQVVIGEWHDKQTLIVSLRKIPDRREVERLNKQCQEDFVNIKSLVSEFYGSSSLTRSAIEENWPFSEPDS